MRCRTASRCRRRRRGRRWLLNPEIGQNVDFITIHLLPYWEGVPVQVCARTRCSAGTPTCRTNSPTSPSSSAKSAGRRKDARAARRKPRVANQAYFIRNFVQLALDKGYDYYIVEAYDQPWKAGNEGAVGAYWGLFDANGNPKFAFTGMLRTFPAWRLYALGGAHPYVPSGSSDPQPHAAREPARLSDDGRARRHRDDGASVAARCEHARIHPSRATSR